MKQKQSQFSEWKDIGFSLELTMDGSPTLRLLDQPQTDSSRAESMHHSGGAFSESVYIYGEIIDLGMKKLRSNVQPLHILSVGLGLGYNELLVAAYALKHNLQSSIQIASFEIVEGLKSAFLDYCEQKELSSEVQGTYDLMLNYYENHFDLKKETLLSLLADLYKNKKWIIHSDFSLYNEKSEFHVLLYDAFSGKTNQELWTEDFLSQKLELISAEQAIFATYACRASLKKALQKSNYDIVIKDGFQGKRNCTQAHRGTMKLEKL